MFHSILSDTTVPRRTIECLEWFVLDERMLKAVHNIHRGRLWKLSIFTFESLTLLRQLGDLLPAITWLHVPPPMAKDYNIVCAFMSFSGIQSHPFSFRMNGCLHYRIFQSYKFFLAVAYGLCPPHEIL